MIVRDVSNYIAIYESGDTKLKGCFEIFQELHKNPSMRIVPIALKEYYVNGIPVEETIKNHTDIYDFCMMLKGNKSWEAELTYFNEDGRLETKPLTRITRYYISKESQTIARRNVESGKIVGVNTGKTISLFNKYVDKPMKEYKIDYSFYISECYKIINAVNDGQLNLF